jgi:hypothetical protein
MGLDYPELSAMTVTVERGEGDDIFRAPVKASPETD